MVLVMDVELVQRAAMHAALGEPIRLAIVDDLVATDRSPKELGQRLGLPTNLLAHHLDVLANAGLINRGISSGDQRRRYVQLQRRDSIRLGVAPPFQVGPMLFLCSRNSARSQLAAALWTARTGQPASSAGTEPAAAVHRRAIVAAKRAGLDLSAATPRQFDPNESAAQVVTVCDRAHEQLKPLDSWWHWSIGDPAEANTAAAFNAVVADLDARILSIIS